LPRSGYPVLTGENEGNPNEVSEWEVDGAFIGQHIGLCLLFDQGTPRIAAKPFSAPGVMPTLAVGMWKCDNPDMATKIGPGPQNSVDY